MITDRQTSGMEGLQPIGLLADKASRLVQTIALPSLVLLVMRVALAVPFWRSGIPKWDGFLKLSDTAVTLFTDEFMLHLPGGPYPFPFRPRWLSSPGRERSFFRSYSSSGSGPASPRSDCCS